MLNFFFRSKKIYFQFLKREQRVSNYLWKFLRLFYTRIVSGYLFISCFPITWTCSATSTLQKISTQNAYHYFIWAIADRHCLHCKVDSTLFLRIDVVCIYSVCNDDPFAQNIPDNARSYPCCYAACCVIKTGFSADDLVAKYRRAPTWLAPLAKSFCWRDRLTHNFRRYLFYLSSHLFCTFYSENSRKTRPLRVYEFISLSYACEFLGNSW